MSAKVDTTLSPELTQAFSQVFAEEIQWYDHSIGLEHPQAHRAGHASVASKLLPSFTSQFSARSQVRRGDRCIVP
jgi:hypothetical protein